MGNDVTNCELYAFAESWTLDIVIPQLCGVINTHRRWICVDVFVQICPSLLSQREGWAASPFFKALGHFVWDEWGVSAWCMSLVMITTIRLRHNTPVYENTSVSYCSYPSDRRRLCEQIRFKSFMPRRKMIRETDGACYCVRRWCCMQVNVDACRTHFKM